MDVEMPEVDGLQAARAIRQLEKVGCSRIPIVAMTAHALPEMEQSCLSAGMNACLTKPVQPDALLKVITELADRSSAESRPCVARACP
jgi:CheY-like chemotaxis protein